MMAKRLLVIDDEADFGTFVGRVASGLGFEVTLTHCAADFQDAYRRFAPTHILVDVIMPDRDGIEIVSWLASEGCKARIFIISGYSSHYAEAAKAIGNSQGLGSVATLKKPISLADLRRALGEHDAKADDTAGKRRSEAP
ncbi:MAG: response regulator [Alphaproteobacteria bacterium]|nr:response regulator [Alphaproteobacteria bacterium]